MNDKQMILIKWFPMPPSVNESLTVANGRMIKSGKARTYLQNALNHKLANQEFYKGAKEIINKWLSVKQTGLRVNAYFSYPKSEIVTKAKDAQNSFRINDVHNRIKQLHDAVASLLEINDCNFIAGDCEKVISESIQDELKVFITIQPHELSTLDEALEKDIKVFK